VVTGVCDDTIAEVIDVFALRTEAHHAPQRGAAAPFRAMFVAFQRCDGAAQRVAFLPPEPAAVLVTRVVPKVPSATHVEYADAGDAFSAFGVPLAWADQSSRCRCSSAALRCRPSRSGRVAVADGS